MHTWAKCPIFLHLLHDSFLAGHFSCGLCALYPHLSHFWACSLLPFGFLKFLAFLCCLDESFFHVTLLTSILGFSPDITCIPSLVASNIRPMLMAVSSVRFLLFSRQRCRTRSSSDLHAMAFRINLFVSVMSSPLFLHHGTYQHSTAMLELNNTRVLFHAVQTELDDINYCYHYLHNNK